VRLYETTFIVNSQADDASLDRQVKAISDLISNNGGRIISEDRIGTRRLAYQIKGLSQGYYTSIIFEGATTLLPILDRHYRLEEPYIRYLTILYEGDVAVVKEEAETTAEKPEEKQVIAEVAGVEEKPEEALEQPAEAPVVDAAEEPVVTETASPIENLVGAPEEEEAEKGEVEPPPQEPDVTRFDDDDEL